MPTDCYSFSHGSPMELLYRHDAVHSTYTSQNYLSVRLVYEAAFPWKFPFCDNINFSSSRFEMANKNIISRTIPQLKTRLLGRIETSGTKNSVRWRHTAEEGNPHGNRCGNLETLLLYFSSVQTRCFLFFRYFKSAESLLKVFRTVKQMDAVF
jgi:hypothetical protein